MAPYDINTPEDADRLRCPNGHASVGPTNNHWLCVTCARHWEDVDAEFDYVIDAKSGEKYHRQDVDIDPEIPGSYYV